MEIITAWLVSYGLQAAAGTIGALILGWILTKIPTGKWSKQLGAAGQKHGQVVSIFCSVKLGGVWNKAIEPIFIDTIGVILSWFSGFIIGLKFDNKD